MDLSLTWPNFYGVFEFYMHVIMQTIFFHALHVSYRISMQKTCNGSYFLIGRGENMEHSLR